VTEFTNSHRNRTSYGETPALFAARVLPSDSAQQLFTERLSSPRHTDSALTIRKCDCGHSAERCVLRDSCGVSDNIPPHFKQQQIALSAVIIVLCHALIEHDLVPRDQLVRKLIDLRTGLHSAGHAHGSDMVNAILDQIRDPNAPPPSLAEVLKFPDPESRDPG
jgi:hypothetical protein